MGEDAFCVEHAELAEFKVPAAHSGEMYKTQMGLGKGALKKERGRY